MHDLADACKVNGFGKKICIRKTDVILFIVQQSYLSRFDSVMV